MWSIKRAIFLANDDSGKIEDKPIGKDLLLSFYDMEFGEISHKQKRGAQQDIHHERLQCASDSDGFGNSEDAI